VHARIKSDAFDKKKKKKKTRVPPRRRCGRLMYYNITILFNGRASSGGRRGRGGKLYRSPDPLSKREPNFVFIFIYI